MKSNYADHLFRNNHNYTNIDENLKILTCESNREKVKED